MAEAPDRGTPIRNGTQNRQSTLMHNPSDLADKYQPDGENKDRI
jgi:hypothetical protein